MSSRTFRYCNYSSSHHFICDDFLVFLAIVTTLHQSKYNWANFILIGAVSRLPPTRRTSKKMVLKSTHKQWLNCKKWGNAPSLPFPSFTFFLSHLFSLPCREAAPWKQIWIWGALKAAAVGSEAKPQPQTYFIVLLARKSHLSGTQFKHCA